MFEKINGKLDKMPDRSAEPTPIDLFAVNAMTERFENAIKEVHKPVKVEHHHKIEIASNWVFLSLVTMAIMIIGLFYIIGNQRQTISQYKDNDLKYRYIRMQGQTNEENLYRMERMFEYRDSVSLVRKQVEKYEQLVKKQADRTERANQEAMEAEKLQKSANSLKKSK
jgi:hypothetical protein